MTSHISPTLAYPRMSSPLLPAESPNWLFPTMILMALGGNQLRMAVLQLGDLFPRQRSTAITLLSGMYAASAALFLVLQVRGY